MARRGGGIVAGVRRLRLHGWTVDAIARLYRLARADVRGMLACPLPSPPPPPAPPPARPPRPPRPGPDPARRILGPLASHVRRRHLAGDSAESIAEALALDVGNVAGFLGRVSPAPGPPRERKPRRKDPPRWPDWHPSNGPEYREATEALPVSESGDHPSVDQPGRPRASPGPGAIDKSSNRAADWGPMMRPRPGALDSDDVVRLRYWRSRRIPLEELARWFDCSVATVKRALRPDYRPAPSPATPAPSPPAIAAAEASEMVRWDPEDDREGY